MTQLSGIKLILLTTTTGFKRKISQITYRILMIDLRLFNEIMCTAVTHIIQYNVCMVRELFVELEDTSNGYSLDRTNAEVHLLLGSLFSIHQSERFPSGSLHHQTCREHHVCKWCSYWKWEWTVGWLRTTRDAPTPGLLSFQLAVTNSSICFHDMHAHHSRNRLTENGSSQTPKKDENERQKQ